MHLVSHRTDPLWRALEQAGILSAITTSADVGSGGSPEPPRAIPVNLPLPQGSDTTVIWDVRAVMTLHFLLSSATFLL